jgi:very-short-patch-repair endonuclease
LFLRNRSGDDAAVHPDTDPRFESDRARTNALIARGGLVLRFTYRRLEQEPFACIAELAQVLSQREAAAA